MSYNEQIYKKILQDYDNIRAVCENKRQQKISEVYEKIPRIKEIKNEINIAGADNVRRIFAEPSKKDYYNSCLREKINQLESEKKSLLLSAGIPIDFDKPVHECNMCEDTGYINGKKCRCFEQKLINEMYSVSNIEKILKEQNFDTFSFKYFKSGEELDRMIKIHDECVRFCDNFDMDGKSMLFFGKTGTGKTFLSSCIAKKLIDMGKTVVYMRASTLFSMYEDYRFGRSDEMKSMMDKLKNADLVIIDDLGTEMKTKTSFSFFLELMNERIQASKKMIINTNFNMSELTKEYSSRFSSRIYEYFNPIQFVGEDIRLKKVMIE